MAWTLLTTPPKKTGNYIVGHRGYLKIIYYLNPNDRMENGRCTWHRLANLGWQEDPRSFGATHYMPVAEITTKDSMKATVDLEKRGLERIVSEPITRETHRRDCRMLSNFCPADVEWGENGFFTKTGTTLPTKYAIQETKKEKIASLVRQCEAKKTKMGFFDRFVFLFSGSKA